MAVTAAVLLAGVGALTVYHFGSGPSKPTEPTTPVVPPTDDIAKVRAVTEQVVSDAIGRQDFPAAARAVRDAEGKKAGQEWVARQTARVVGEWRQHAEAQRTDNEKRAEFEKLLVVYPGDTDAKTRVAALTFNGQYKHANDLLLAALTQLREGGFPECRAKLSELDAELVRLGQTDGAAEVQQQIAAKRNEADDVRNAATDLEKLARADATEQFVGELATKVAGMKAAGVPANKLALREAYRRVLAGKVEQVVPKLSATTKWKELLDACHAATSVAAGSAEVANPWVAACGAECVAELHRRLQPVGREEWTVPPPGSEPRLAAYCKYVSAARQWTAAGTSGSKDAAAAVADLAADTADPPINYLNDYRRGRVLADLRTAANKLRGPDALAPFAGAGPEAAKWLAAANRLSEKDQKLSPPDRLRLKFDLALAYLAQRPPDAKRAQPLTEELAANVKVLQPSVQEQVLLWNAAARSQDATPAGRQAAVKAYIRVLEVLRDDLAGVPADFLYTNLIRPLDEDAGKAILGAAPDRPTKLAAAKLYFLSGRNVRRYADAWAEVKDLSERDRQELVVRLFGRAAGLDKKPEYEAWAGIAMSEVAGVSAIPAVPAGAGAGGVPAVALLRGIALIAQAEQLKDRAKRVEAWRQADAQFRDGIDQCGKRPEFRDELVLLYQRAANNCILLANALAGTQPGEMKRYLDDAKATLTGY